MQRLRVEEECLNIDGLLGGQTSGLCFDSSRLRNHLARAASTWRLSSKTSPVACGKLSAGLRKARGSRRISRRALLQSARQGLYLSSLRASVEHSAYENATLNGSRHEIRRLRQPRNRKPCCTVIAELDRMARGNSRWGKIHPVAPYSTSIQSIGRRTSGCFASE